MQINLLSTKEYEGHVLEFKYTTEYYYDVVIDPNEIFSINIIKRPFGKELDKGFIGKLYEDHLEEPSAFSLTDDKEVLGYLEVDRERWNNRLRITEIIILDGFRGKNYGRLLINKAKEMAQKEGFREVILETQSCNSKAIEFYLKNGFKINGLDLSSYTNDDVGKKEVRFEMVYRMGIEI